MGRNGGRYGCARAGICVCVCVCFSALSSERRQPFFNVAGSDGDAIARCFSAIHPLHLANSHAAREGGGAGWEGPQWGELKVNMMASHLSNSREIIQFIR